MVKTNNWEEVVQRIGANDGSEIKLDIERAGATKTLELKPEKLTEDTALVSLKQSKLAFR